MKEGYRELVISRAEARTGGMSLSFEDCCIGFELSNSFFEEHKINPADLVVGRMVDIKGTLGNEDVMLACPNPLAAIELVPYNGDFNKNHPERRDDEVFVTNSEESPGRHRILGDDAGGYAKIGWKTKRKGTVSYSATGEVLGDRWKGSFPVFVKQNEIRNAEHGEEILARLLPEPEQK